MTYLTGMPEYFVFDARSASVGELKQAPKTCGHTKQESILESILSRLLFI
jgi:hypothetical protein